jgi:hypothetical protein
MGETEEVEGVYVGGRVASALKSRMVCTSDDGERTKSPHFAARCGRWGSKMIELPFSAVRISNRWPFVFNRSRLWLARVEDDTEEREGRVGEGRRHKWFEEVRGECCRDTIV